MVLPNIKQAHDVWVVQQLHDTDLTLQAEGYDRTALCRVRVCLRTFDQVGHADGADLLRNGFGHNLCCTFLVGNNMSHDADTGTPSSADCLSQFPWTDAFFVSAAITRSCACRGHLRVALWIVRPGILIDHRRQALVLWRRYGQLGLDRQCAIWSFGLFVCGIPWRR